MRNRIGILAALSVLPLLAGIARAEGARAFVVDPAARTLLVVDLQTGRRGEPVELPLRGQEPEVFLTPDRSRLVVLDPGATKITWNLRLKPLAPSFVTILDAATLRVLASHEVGWGLTASAGLLTSVASTALTADGRRLAVYCAGYDTGKPAEFKPRELVILDLASGAIEGRLAFERPLSDVIALRDGRLLGFNAAGEARKNTPEEPARLVFIDPVARNVVQETTVPGAPRLPLLSPDGERLYLLDPGKPSGKPEKNVAGTLSVVSTASGAIEATLDAGSSPRALAFDPSRSVLLLLADAGPRTRAGELRVVRGAELLATVGLPEGPRFLKRHDERVFVACRDAVAEIDGAQWRELRRVPLGDELPSELGISPDGRRALVLFEGSSKLEILDLEAPSVVARLTTGRGGVKFAKTLGAIAASAAATAASYGHGMSVAQTQNRSYFTYNVYAFGPGATRTSLVIGPDGRYAYALNTQTNDVSVVDVAAATVQQKIACGGRVLAPLAEGGPLAVLGKDTLRLFDTARQMVAGELRFEDSARVELLATPDRDRVLAIGGRTLALLDSGNGAIVDTLTAGAEPAVGFDPGPAAGDAER